MEAINGILLIRRTELGAISYMNLVTGQVDFKPAVKYRIEKKNAFDPTLIIRRDAYHEDTIECQAVVEPGEYHDLYAFLIGEGQLYAEWTAYDQVNHQYAVEVSALPEQPDDLHEYPEKVKFSLISRYTGVPGYNDFGIIIQGDTDETVIAGD
jgi:hypothetical protein